MISSPDNIKTTILESLVGQGFNLNTDNSNIIAAPLSKDKIRSLHSKTRLIKIKNNLTFIRSNINNLSQYFADGKDITLELISPRLVAVETGTEMSRLFKLATFLWSVPVSQGFGRRSRFLIFDNSNNKLIGLFAIGDPVFNLKVRDDFIGWDHLQKAKRLYNVMDIFTLGAVPPYSDLLCGKLVAMLAASNEVRTFIYDKYRGTTTQIRKENKEPHLALLTTTSALGRSSLYNRITYDGYSLYKRLGITKGWGHFHLGDSIFELMRQFLQTSNHPIAFRNRFGQGPNWKMRLSRTCLKEIGLSSDLLRHGICRDVYGIPLAENYCQYLLGHEDVPKFHDLPFTDLVRFFKSRWLLSRPERIKRIQNISRFSTLSEFYELTNN